MDSPQPVQSDQANYSCDTLPTPRHLHRPSGTALSRSPSPLPTPPAEDAVPSSFEIVTPEEVHSEFGKPIESPPAQPPDQAQTSENTNTPPQPPARKLCVRHQRMADEGTNLKIQKVSRRIQATAHTYMHSTAFGVRLIFGGQQSNNHIVI